MGDQRTQWRAAVAAAVVLCAAACADDSGGAVELGSPSAASTEAGPAADGPAGEEESPFVTPLPTAAPRSDHDCASGANQDYGRAARCLYRAFVADDRGSAAMFATQNAVDQLFQLRGHPVDAQWRFEGCSTQASGSSSSSGSFCHFAIPGDVHGVRVELAMRADGVVEGVVTLG